MIPILMLSIPPIAVGGGYGCWSLGQHSVLKWKGVPDSPPQTLGSFGVGGAAFICIYGLQSMMFSNVKYKTTKNDMVSTKVESASTLKNTKIPLHKQSSSLHYQPPKSLEETFHRVGRPIIMRLGAGGVSFFCAGVVQTLVLYA